MNTATCTDTRVCTNKRGTAKGMFGGLTKPLFIEGLIKFLTHIKGLIIMSITYKSCEPVSDKFREHNDCTVKAIAIATDTPYIKAHSIMKDLGRINRRGVSSFKWTFEVSVDAVEILGFTAKGINIPDATVASLRNHLDNNKNYIITIRGHTLAYVNGVIQDHTNPAFNSSRKKTSSANVKCVLEVTRTISKNAQRKLARYG
jgi:hypothetical protein|tara:strand:- start:83 stop:688 length:606 start_codon:yes stop_codon:yes gene_type:complete